MSLRDELIVQFYTCNKCSMEQSPKLKTTQVRRNPMVLKKNRRTLVTELHLDAKRAKE